MILNVISLIIISIVFVIIAIDVIPILSDWICRIHIGKWKDKKKWNKSITNIGVRWLNKTPNIKVTDNTRLVVIDMLKKNYTKSTIQYWQEATLLLGLLQYLKYSQDKIVKNEIVKFLKSKFDKDGQWIEKPKNIDGAILAYALLKVEFIDINKYKNALDYTWNMIKDHIGEDGTVQYRKSVKDCRYVDTLGFICPFLVAYGIRFNKEECIDLAINQIKEFEQYAMLSSHYIPCHAYKIQDKIPLGLYGWGRGVGWFAIGLVDLWNELPLENKYKSDIDKIVIKLAKAVMKFQQDDGSWNWVISRDECRADSSTTATLCWLMLNVSNIVEISKECLESAENAFKYLMKVTRRNGMVDFSQGDTKDIGVYSMLFNTLPFTQGFTIRCINLYLMKYKSNSYKKFLGR